MGLALGCGTIFKNTQQKEVLKWKRLEAQMLNAAGVYKHLSWPHRRVEDFGGTGSSGIPDGRERMSHREKAVSTKLCVDLGSDSGTLVTSLSELFLRDRFPKRLPGGL